MYTLASPRQFAEALQAWLALLIDLSSWRESLLLACYLLPLPS